MMNPKRTLRGPAVFLTAAAACGILVVGCGSEPERQAIEQPAPRPAPAPPPMPTVKPVAELMAELRIDDRVQLPEEHAPATTEERVAVLEFFDAFARGDHEAAGRMMTELDRRELRKLVDSGDWTAVTSKIRRIDIQTGDTTYGKAALGLYDVGDNFQAQLWYFAETNGEYSFEAERTPPNIVDRLSGTNWIAAWHAIIEEEDMLASKPDETVRIQQQNLDPVDSGNDSSYSGPVGPPTGPAPAPTSPPTGPAPPSRTPPGNPLPPGGR